MKRYIFLIIFLLIPMKTFAVSDMNISFDDKYIDIDNFLYNNRTYVDLYDFCSLTGYCEIDNTDNKNVKKITEEISNGTFSYTYEVYHEIGTNSFDSRIIIGNDSIKLTQNNIDVTSCPKNAKKTCDDTKLYVPIRFLSQALGKSVDWKDNNVYIKNNLYQKFEEKYNVFLTHKVYYENEVINNNIVIKENNVFKIPQEYISYVYVTDKSNVVIPFTKEFAFFDKNLPKESKNDGSFEIVKEEKSKLIAFGNVGSTSSIAQILMFNRSGDSTDGVYPIVIPNYYEITNKVEIKKQRYIFISPSLQGYNPYICKNTNEMAEMTKLADLVEQKLKSKDWITVYRTPQIPSGEEAYKEAINWGKLYYDNLDLYLCLHSNASSTKKERGIMSVNNPSFNSISTMYSNILRNAIASVHPTKNDAGVWYKSVGENNPINAKYSAYLEIGFHDNYADCEWLVSDFSKEDISNAIANTLINYWENNQ